MPIVYPDKEASVGNGFQIGGVEALGEPAVYFGEHRDRLVALALPSRAAARGSSSRAIRTIWSLCLRATSIARSKQFCASSTLEISRLSSNSPLSL
jgi:hypothetical protein